jgi:hypothetical protein
MPPRQRMCTASQTCLTSQLACCCCPPLPVKPQMQQVRGSSRTPQAHCPARQKQLHHQLPGCMNTAAVLYYLTAGQVKSRRLQQMRMQTSKQPAASGQLGTHQVNVPCNIANILLLLQQQQQQQCLSVLSLQTACAMLRSSNSSLSLSASWQTKATVYCFSSVSDCQVSTVLHCTVLPGQHCTSMYHFVLSCTAFHCQVSTAMRSPQPATH